MHPQAPKGAERGRHGEAAEAEARPGEWGMEGYRDGAGDGPLVDMDRTPGGLLK
jgi:hypothetical protein